jgi:hypothetical protein
VLLARIERQLAEQPGSLPEFVVARPRSVAELRAHLEPLEPFLEGADVLFDAGEEHPGRVAEKLYASLDRLLDVERLDP